jgi:hypothetical protein
MRFGKSRSRSALLVLAFIAAPAVARAADRNPSPEDDRTDAASLTPRPPSPAGFRTTASAMLGLVQWTLLRGGNVAAEYKVGRLAFEISHGQGLDLNQSGGVALSPDERRAGAQVRVPWTTGFGVGYRIFENLHVLLEFKAHHFDVTGRDSAAAVSYTTFSVGPGVFYSVYLTKGLFLEPNVRFWPTVASTLPGNAAFLRQPDGTVYEHHAHDWGLFANVNLGYSF